MSKILASLVGWKGYAAVAAVCLLLGASATWRVMSWRADAQQVKTLTKTVEKIVYRDRVSERVVTKYLAAKAQAAEETSNRIEEVENHVTPEADAACVVPLGFVWVWNDAVRGPLPDPASGPDDAPSGLACSDIAKAFVEAAGQYDAVAGQLTALQSWVREQHEAPK